MFSGNNNRSPHCPRGFQSGGFLSASKHGVYDGKRSKQMGQPVSVSASRTFITSATQQFPVVFSPGSYVDHQDYNQQRLQQVRNQQLAIAAFSEHQLPTLTQSSWHTISKTVPERKRSPPPKTEIFPGFLDGIKQIVKGIINPISFDLYNDKSCNKKNEQTCSPEELSPSHATLGVSGKHEINENDVNKSKTCNNVSRQVHVNAHITASTPSSNATDILALFTPDDFPELPASRRLIAQSPPLNSISKDIETKIVSSTDQIAVPVKETSPFEISSSLILTLTPLNLVSNPKFCFFEIEFKTVETRQKHPRMRSHFLSSTTKNSKTPIQNICRKKPDDDFISPRKTVQMVFCDSDDDDSDNDVRVSLVQRSQTKDLVPGENFACGLSRPRRQRQISECSDDSFIVCFSEEAGDGLQIFDTEELDESGSNQSDANESDDSEEEYTDDDDDADDDDYDDLVNIKPIVVIGADVVDSSSTSPKHIPSMMPHTQNLKTDIDRCNPLLRSNKGKMDNQNRVTLDIKSVCVERQPDSGFDEDRKVRFNLQLEIHVIRAWNFAYRAARKGHWEDYARDRERFRKRIERSAVFLNPILTQQHREKIYQSRFCKKDEELSKIQCTRLDI